MLIHSLLLLLLLCWFEEVITTRSSSEEMKKTKVTLLYLPLNVLLQGHLVNVNDKREKGTKTTGEMVEMKKFM